MSHALAIAYTAATIEAVIAAGLLEGVDCCMPACQGPMHSGRGGSVGVEAIVEGTAWTHGCGGSVQAAVRVAQGGRGARC
jgi:hypothetical protein